MDLGLYCCAAAAPKSILFCLLYKKKYPDLCRPQDAAKTWNLFGNVDAIKINVGTKSPSHGHMEASLLSQHTYYCWWYFKAVISYCILYLCRHIYPKWPRVLYCKNKDKMDLFLVLKDNDLNTRIWYRKTGTYTEGNADVYIWSCERVNSEQNILYYAINSPQSQFHEMVMDSSHLLWFTPSSVLIISFPETFADSFIFLLISALTVN